MLITMVFYCTSPHESIYHSDVVLSINSTMLFEARLINRPAISVCYFDFKSMWAETDIVRVYNRTELFEEINYWLTSHNSNINLKWANENLAPNEGFDGKAATRIGEAIKSAMISDNLTIYNKGTEFVLGNCSRGGNIAINSLKGLKEGTKKYLASILECDHLGYPQNGTEAFSYDHFFAWGLQESDSKKHLNKCAKSVGKSLMYIEDSFVRSLGMGLTGDPCLGVILDDITPYYNSRIESRLSKILNSSIEFTSSELDYADNCMKKISCHKITKYNHAPYHDLAYTKTKKHSILLVDQRRGDMSLVGGNANDETFKVMFDQAVNNYPDSNIFIKIHPDALIGGKKSCFQAIWDNQESIVDKHPNVQIISESLNPHSLLDISDEVWVATSGLGFEALIAGKIVRCFGSPFYAGGV